MSFLSVDRAAAIEVWDNALCAEVDPALFFPGKGEPAEPAKQICRRCGVRELCLETFGPIIDDGVVGGLTARERQKLRKKAKENAA